jgi:predicted GIY-YIG superfamily endonuclease
MLNRLCYFPMNQENKSEELKNIKQIAKINGYGKTFVDRLNKKHIKKENLRRLTTLTQNRSDESTTRATISFYPGMTNQLQRIFYKHKIKLVFSNKDKLSDGLGNSKDKIDILEKSGIYQIKCQGCDAVYIGQTRRNATTRFKKHFRNIRYNRPQLSSVANHILEHVNEPWRRWEH